jgi:hypothetical protein
VGRRYGPEHIGWAPLTGLHVTSYPVTTTGGHSCHASFVAVPVHTVAFSDIACGHLAMTQPARHGPSSTAARGPRHGAARPGPSSRRGSAGRSPRCGSSRSRPRLRFRQPRRAGGSSRSTGQRCGPGRLAAASSPRPRPRGAGRALARGSVQRCPSRAAAGRRARCPRPAAAGEARQGVGRSSEPNTHFAPARAEGRSRPAPERGCGPQAAPFRRRWPRGGRASRRAASRVPQAHPRGG